MSVHLLRVFHFVQNIAIIACNMFTFHSRQLLVLMFLALPSCPLECFRILVKIHRLYTCMLCSEINDDDWSLMARFCRQRTVMDWMWSVAGLYLECSVGGGE